MLSHAIAPHDMNYCPRPSPHHLLNMLPLIINYFGTLYGGSKTSGVSSPFLVPKCLAHQCGPLSSLLVALVHMKQCPKPLPHHPLKSSHQQPFILELIRNIDHINAHVPSPFHSSKMYSRLIWAMLQPSNQLLGVEPLHSTHSHN